jgi:hypothetical protein
MSDLTGYSDDELRAIAAGNKPKTPVAGVPFRRSSQPPSEPGSDISNTSDAELQEIVDLGNIAARMTSQDLSIARSKNDRMGEYLRQQAKQPRPGESEADRFKRLYGGLSMPKRPGMGEGILRAFSEGSTFGHSGEIGAAGRAAYDALINDRDFSKEYKARLSQSDTKLDQFREDSPVAAYGTEIAGAIPTSLLPGLNILRGGNVAKSVGTGVLQGGLYGHGQSRGDLAERVKTTPRRTSNDARLASLDVLLGSIVGGTIGAAGIPIAKGLGNLANRYMTKKAAGTVGMTGPQYQILNRALSADDALTGGGARRMDAAGPDSMLADAGSGTQRLLDTAIVESPPAARIATEAVESRVNSAASKLDDVLNSTMGRPGESASRALTIYGDKSSPLRKLYERAYSKPVNYSSPLGVEIENIVRNQVPPEAITAANKLMRMEGHASRQILADIAEDGSVVFREMPDVRQLDYITRGLNQSASTGEGAGAMGGQTQIGSAYKNLSREIRSRLKELVPEYKAVLNSAMDIIRARDARDIGLTVLSTKTTRADVMDAISGMGEAEIRKVVEGVRMNIDDILARTKVAMTDVNIEAREAFQLIKDMSSRSNREKLTMILGDDAERIFNQLDEAVMAFELRGSVARNSATAIRQSTAQSVKDVVQGGSINRLREGEVINAPKEMISAIFGRSPEAKQKISDDVYIGMVRALIGPRGAEARAALDQLQKVAPLIDKRTGRVMDITKILAARNAPVTSPMMEALGAR